MKYTIGVLAIGALLLGGTTRAEALALTPADTTCTTNTNSNLDAAALYTQLDGCFDVTALSLSPIYKNNLEGGENEPGYLYLGSYETTYDNEPDDPADALIEYVSGQPVFNCLECYLVVKDGNQTPAQYFFDISGWNGTDDISLTGFWPGRGAISHVEIVGVARPTIPDDPPPSVPEPTSFLLIGVGFGMAALRLRKKRS